MRVTSTSALGRASRRFIIGTRLCPPARIFASSPRPASPPGVAGALGIPYFSTTPAVHREPRMAPPHLRVEHTPAGYRRLLLSRPERRNALDLGLARALRDALEQDETAPVVLGSTD